MPDVFDTLAQTNQAKAGQDQIPPAQPEGQPASGGDIFDQLAAKKPVAQAPQGPQAAAPQQDAFDNLAAPPSAAPKDPFPQAAAPQGDVFDQLAAKTPGAAAPTDANADEAERMGEGEAWYSRPVTTYLGIPEYRQGAGPIERGAEKFASGMASPISLGLMIVTGGLGSLAEGAGATALKGLAPEIAPQVMRAAGTISKLANVGFTGQQVYGLSKSVPQIGDAIKAGDYDTAEELMTQAALSTIVVGLSTSHLVKSFKGGKEPVWTKDKEVLAASQQPQKLFGTRALQFAEANKELINNKPLDMAARLYHEAGGDPATLEKWRQEIVDDGNIKKPIQDKYDALLRQAQDLPDEVKGLSAKLREDYVEDWDKSKAMGKTHPDSEGAGNYSGQHTYIPEDEGESTLRFTGNKRLTKTPGFLKERKFDTIVDALHAGFEPTEQGLAGARADYIKNFGGMVGANDAEAALYKQNADDNRPLAADPAKVKIVGNRKLIKVAPGADLSHANPEELSDVWRGPERRVDVDLRKKVSELTPDELKTELLTSKVADLPNRRAFDEVQGDKPSLAVGMSDADGLKAFNDKFGYEAGNALLKAKAEALKEAGLDAFHDKGDEFLYRGDDPAEIKAKLDKARSILKEKEIVVDYDGKLRKFKGADFSYGTGTDIAEAERGLKAHKSAREATGERARGELRGITEAGPKEGALGESGLQDDQVTNVHSTVRPEDFLRRVGADEHSLLAAGSDEKTIAAMAQEYRSGKAIEPVQVHLDRSGRVIDDAGAERAVAAARAGIERIPVIVRRTLEKVEAGETKPRFTRGPVQTDSEILQRALEEKFPGKTLDDLDKSDRKIVTKHAENLKVQQKSEGAAGPTAVRRPILDSQGKLVVYKGELYHDVSDYRPGPKLFDKFRYRATDKYNDPIFERSSALIHPDFHDPIMRSFDDTSWFQKNSLMRGLLRASTEAKKSLLSFSPFHRTTMYLRGIQMGLTPREAWNPPPLTENSLAVRAKFGTTLSVENQRSAIAEGAASNRHIINKLPFGVGKLLGRVEDNLFGAGGYIDRLKAATFEKVTGQLTKRHPNWNEDQVQFQASKIVDAAYGGLNWKMLGASMNSVDALRLIALAPDFTGSQILFAKSGFEPGGSVVGQSLARIALYNFGVARVLNMLTSGHLHPEHPFSVVSPDGKKVYSIRTMPADIAHALTDPRGFIYNRLNPLLVRTGIEAITGRDEHGKQVTVQKELHDLLRNVLPIPAQGFIPSFQRDAGATPLESIGENIARGFGINAQPERTTASRVAGELASAHTPSGPVNQEQLDKHQAIIQLEDALRSGQIKSHDLYNAYESGTISVKDAKEIMKNITETKGMDQDTARTYSRATRLPMREFLQVWEVATPPEKKAMMRLFETKAARYFKTDALEMTREQRMKDPTYLKVRSLLPHKEPW